MTDYEKYLGLSMVCGKLKVSTFKGIQEGIQTSAGLDGKLYL